MRKITFLFISLMMCLSTSAKITVTPLLLGGTPLSGDIQLTVATWADFHLCNKLLSINDYPKLRIVYEGAVGKLFAYVKCGTTNMQSLMTFKDSAYVDTTFVLDKEKIAVTDSFDIDIQGQAATNTVHIKKVAFIAPDGTEMIPTYKMGRYGTSVGSYSGIATRGQWVRMGGTPWVPTHWAKGEIHDFTIKLNAPVPNSRWYFIYTKPGAKNETYINLPEGRTEFTVSFNTDYGNSFFLQSQTANNQLDIASMTRTVYAPVYEDTTTLYSDENGTDMGDWQGSVIIPAEKFANAKIYDIISVKICNATATSKIGFRENTEDMPALSSELNEVKLTDTTYVFNYTIKDAAVLAKLKENGVNISGNDFAITGVSLITTDDSYDPNATPTAIKIASEADANVVETTIYNVAGQETSTMSKGINIVRQRMSDGTSRVKKVLLK